MSVVSTAPLHLRTVVRARHCWYFLGFFADTTFSQNLDANLAFILIVAATLYIVLPFLFRKNLVDKNGNSIPHGPLLRLPYLPDYPERTLHAWAQKYGPLYSFFLGNQLYVVVSDPNVARELLVNNGAIFSSRKQYFVKNQTILKGRAITGSPYGETWYVAIRFESQSPLTLGIAGASTGRSPLSSLRLRRFRATATPSTTRPAL